MVDCHTAEVSWVQEPGQRWGQRRRGATVTGPLPLPCTLHTQLRLQPAFPRPMPGSHAWVTQMREKERKGNRGTEERDTENETAL